MKSLIIVDMQEKYIGKNSKYANRNKLIHNINLKISQYKSNVIYIKNTALEKTSTLIEELNIVSNNIFLKSKSSCFSDEKLKEYLLKNNIKELEFAGIDGNQCIKSSILDAVNLGYKVEINLACIGAKNMDNFKKTLKIFEKNNIIIK